MNLSSSRAKTISLILYLEVNNSSYYCKNGLLVFLLFSLGVTSLIFRVSILNI